MNACDTEITNMQQLGMNIDRHYIDRFRAPYVKSHGFGFESHCGQEFLILYSVAYDALLAGRQVSYKCNQA